MTDTTKPEFQIGETVYYAYAYPHADNHVPCPLCFGKKSVQIILGNGEIQPIECSACGHGYEGPRGFINERAPRSAVVRGEITGVTKDFGEWRYAVNGSSQSDIFRTEEEAETKRVLLHAEASVQAEGFNQSIAKEKKKGLAWSVRYHQGCIRDLERRLSYHEEKLLISREKAAKKAKVAL
jgi:hypothetical protein